MGMPAPAPVYVAPAPAPVVYGAGYSAPGFGTMLGAAVGEFVLLADHRGIVFAPRANQATRVCHVQLVVERVPRARVPTRTQKRSREFGQTTLLVR
jgi:hypothetical protein